MKIGYLILIMLCCSTCKKEDYREKYVGVYKTSKFSLYQSSGYRESQVSSGKIEISISNDAPDLLIATFDDSLNSKIDEVMRLLYLISSDNQLFLQVNENGIINANVYNYINPEISINLKIEHGELNAMFLNRVVLSQRISHLLKGKRAL